MLLGGMTWLVVTEWYRRGVGNYEKGTKCSFFWDFLSSIRKKIATGVTNGDLYYV